MAHIFSAVGSSEFFSEMGEIVFIILFYNKLLFLLMMWIKNDGLEFYFSGSESHTSSTCYV